MISRKSEEVLNRAGRYALEKHHEYCTLEHVLWSLLHEPYIREIIEACGADPVSIKRAVEGYLDQEIPKAGLIDGSAPNAEVEPPIATLAVQRLIQRAMFHVQSSGKDEVLPSDLFVALFQAKDSHALYLLLKSGIERLDVLSFISHGVRSKEDSYDDENENNELDESTALTEPGSAREDKKKTREKDPLLEFCTNLNDLAKKEKIDPLIGRQSELDRIIQTLCRRRKNNPLLVGEAGVGKTALAEGLALRIISGEVPDLLQKAEVYSLDLGSLLAGTKFRGDFEQRLKKVMNSLVLKKEKGGYPILFIDEVHTIIGAGAVSGGALDAANLLKPLLSRGELQCIGSTTYTEYRNVFEKDHALSRRFQKIDISEPSIEDAIQILKGLKIRFESHHEIEYTDDAIRSAVELSVKHLSDRFLPDKAIDLIDEAGAKVRLAKKKVVDRSTVEEVVAQVARIPARSVSTNQKLRLKNLDRDLRLTIFGQDHAIEALVTAIRLSRSGLRSGDKPVGSFLFCGPTGVGKTELTKQVANSMGAPLLRFDMSEYMEKHTVSRLIGAPPGYVGYEQAGLLTEGVRKNPHAVILLDEIEKAHQDVWNLLLQVMDHGTLTDNYGRKADFRNAILIMTSNVGARDMEKRPLGMSNSNASAASSQKEVERTFSPEFRNRLDAIIYFNPLDSMTIAQVVGKQLAELESQLLAKNVELEVAPEVREWLSQKGYDRVMGARPMARLIQEKIRKPLSEEILFGKLEHGGTVRVSIRKSANATAESSDNLEFEYIARKASDPQSGFAEADPETHSV